LLENTPWTPPSSGYYATDAYTEYAVERIREHRTAHASQPFFMYVAYTAPHFPLHALPEDIARTSGGTTRLCGNEQSSHSGILWGERVCHPSAGQHQRVDPAAE
ncbi:MAG: sulfatase-like hydrolase/transferase, partial [Gemmatimonadetes bacterium]|nr:sulfatase-like hydrolase/transferase [Gemmatimonadota bacterium]